MIEYCSIPSFRRLVAFLKTDDVSGYGCIAINDSISIWQFVTEIEEQSKHPVAVIDFINEKCNALLETKLLQDTLNDNPGKVLVMVHMEMNIENDDDAILRLVSVINGNRENIIEHDGVVLFVFSKWFLKEMYRKGPDFFSSVSFHADYTFYEGYRIISDHSYSFGYEQFMPIKKKAILATDIKDETLLTSDRLSSAKEYLSMLRQHAIRDEETIGIILGLVEDKKNHTRYKMLVLEIYASMVCYLSRMNEYFRAYDVYLKVMNMPVDDLTSVVDKIKVLNIKAEICLDVAEFERALEYGIEAIALRPVSTMSENMQLRLADAYTNIGAAQWHMGNYEDAIESYGMALTMRQAVLVNDHPLIASSYHNIGLAYNNMSDIDNALECYHTAMGIYKKSLGIEHPEIANILNDISQAYDMCGNDQKARAYENKALAIREKILGKGHPDTLDSKDTISWLEYSISGKEPGKSLVDYLQDEEKLTLQELLKLTLSLLSVFDQLQRKNIETIELDPEKMMVESLLNDRIRVRVFDAGNHAGRNRISNREVMACNEDFHTRAISFVGTVLYCGMFKSQSWIETSDYDESQIKDALVKKYPSMNHEMFDGMVKLYGCLLGCDKGSNMQKALLVTKTVLAICQEG